MINLISMKGLNIHIYIYNLLPSSIIAVAIDVVGDFCFTARRKYSTVTVSCQSEMSHATGLPIIGKFI